MDLPISQIAEGFYNNLTNRKLDLYYERIEICKKCKLLKVDEIWGKMCNNKLYLNPTTDEISENPKEGFKRGCGCILKAKCRVRESSCPLGKW